MGAARDSSTEIGLLFGGGLDSGILLAHLLRPGRTVQPFYIRCGLVWEGPELDSAQRYVKQLTQQQALPNRLKPLVVFDLPLADVYRGHWSVTGQEVPGYETPDEAVYLPARNALLLSKPLVWCQLHGIEELALATLAGNPFSDATREFDEAFAQAMTLAGGSPVHISRPFATLHKPAVMQLAGDAPLELTFSCMAPHSGRHCGDCNKCAERQMAFRAAQRPDPTDYVRAARS